MNNKRWSSDDKIKLIKLYSDGNTFEEIGKVLDRSQNAIKLRLESIVYENLTKGKSILLLSKMMKKDKETLKQLYYSHKSFKQARNEVTKDIIFTEEKKSNNKEQINNMKYENEILDIILKNYKLKDEIKILYNDNKLNKNTKMIIEKML